MIRGYLVHLSMRTSLEAFYNQKWFLNILACKIWDSVSTHFPVYCALQSTGYFYNFQKYPSEWSLFLNLGGRKSFFISIYYMLTYEVNSINQSLEDITTYMCLRAWKKAIQTYHKNAIFGIFDKRQLKN